MFVQQRHYKAGVAWEEPEMGQQRHTDHHLDTAVQYTQPRQLSHPEQLGKRQPSEKLSSHPSSLNDPYAYAQPSFPLHQAQHAKQF